MNAAGPSACPWCREPKRIAFYRGKREARCTCRHDYRTPVEARRDAVLDKYGDDPTAYTPPVLKDLAEQGLFDIAAAFCPAGRLTMAETLAREASAIEAGTAETAQTDSVHESAVPDRADATPSPSQSESSHDNI